MTLTLSPPTEARLRAVAAQRRLPPEEALAQVLAEAQSDFEDAAAGIGRGMADAEAGREMTLEEYRAQIAREDAAHMEQAE